ncbi:type II secretion system F family protein [Salipaludibacillus sp. CF4.18]|uniref:type II secretion system F family protein n=1 Tax=Salipaludibacillus sp. CF4.18 TaxID=3373081 RepID=UPI003EE6373F
MTGLLLISLYISSFLLLLSFGLLLSPSKATEAEGSSVKVPLTMKGLLRGGNDLLKKLLIRKKKASKKKESLENQLSVAGIPMKPEEFTAFQWFASIIIGGVLHLLLGNWLFFVIGAAFGLILPKIWLKGKQKKRIKQFNDALPGMITSIIGSLRAGFSFPQSLQMIAEESYSPIKEEVQLVLKSMQYGTNVEDALVEWKNRMPSEDLDLLVEAILIQRQVGGNLAYLLGKIVDTTRERTKIQDQIKTLTAQGRLSGIIISLLPVVLGFIIYLMNPAYITTLFIHPIGQVMLGIALIGGIIGFVLIKKITTIEV